jgi:integrase
VATPRGGGRPPDTRATGQVLAYKRKDGLTSWYLRVRAYGNRHRINLGTELEGWTRARARIELQNVLAKIQAGIWEPPAPASKVPDDPTFHQFASSWLARRRPSYKPRTYEHYRYLLTHHLLPAFAALRLSQLDYASIDRYVEAKQLESEEIREATGRGVTLTNASGRRKRPLANSTINATVELLIGVLDEAVRRKLLVVNPAREKGLRLKEQRPRGNVLEIDELEDLLAGAAEIDQKVTPKVLERGATARALRDQGVAWKEIGRRLGVAEATAIYYAQQHVRRRISARRTIIACLAGCGLRNTELCGIDVRDVDFAHGNIHVADAKTEAGVRKVDLSPMLRDELLAWRASLDAPAPESPFFPTRAGSRRDKDNINARVIRPAVRRANERRALRDLPPLPTRVTAHTLRRTYISMMFAAGAEIPYVMAQVGHGDSKVTLEIYARVLKRRDREQIGRAFDYLLVGGGRGEPRTPARAARRPIKRSKTAARRGRNPG